MNPSDIETVAEIYNEFRFAIARAGQVSQVTYRDLETILEAAIKRCHRRIEDEQVKAAVIEKFTQAKNRLADWVDDESLRSDICSVHEMPRFLCSCAKDPLPDPPQA